MTFRAMTLAVGVAAVAAGGTPAGAAMLPFYVGVDGLSTIASGTYAGLANPNHNRLTFLLAHTYPELPSSNHYHSKGVQVYTGANLGAATAVTTSASDYLPEGANPPVALTAGSGVYAGKLASGPDTFTTGNTRSLNGFASGSGEAVLFGSSSGRWNTAFDAADIHWELVSLTPGLHVGTAATLNAVVNPGDDLHLGGGDENFAFSPVLWTDPTATAGVYEAAFRLVDENGVFGDSGTVRLRTEVVPEPAALGLIGLGSVVMLRRKRATT